MTSCTRPRSPKARSMSETRRCAHCRPSPSTTLRGRPPSTARRRSAAAPASTATCESSDTASPIPSPSTLRLEYTHPQMAPRLRKRRLAGLYSWACSIRRRATTEAPVASSRSQTRQASRCPKPVRAPVTGLTRTATLVACPSTRRYLTPSSERHKRCCRQRSSASGWSLRLSAYC